MKKILISLSIVLFLAISCQEKDDYDYSKIEPGKTAITGPSSILTGIGAEFNALARGGSSFEWKLLEGGPISFTAVEGKPHCIFINSDATADTSAVISVTETTAGGIVGVPDTVSFLIYLFCALDNGITDLIGSWGGTDAYYYESIVTTELSGDDIIISGLGEEFMGDWWGEAITDKGTVIIEIDASDGSIVIPEQYIYTTDYDGTPYTYNISGSGKWNNCGAAPTIELEYDFYNVEDDYWIGAEYGEEYMEGLPYLKAVLVLSSK